ncbi:MAG: carbamate kinase [Bacteroidetes bacterium]|nr:MAG: carbamate kinase [Bacteroidota bacterium]
MKKLAVVALGGNALLRGNQIGTIEEQEQNTADTLKNLLYLIKDGYDIIIAHGNGPQVGNILMRNDAGEQMYNIAQMPLDICVADSQGGIGYMIERMLRNVLKENNIDKEVVTIVTQVIVDKNDPAFQDPQKRVGKIYDKEQADKLAKEKGWIFKEEVKANGGWRRVVPSPKPISFMNAQIVEDLARQGNIVITVGGGGIPVYIDENNNVRPSEAVIDKDLASAMVGAKVKADEFYILTDVPFVYLNYKKENEKKLEFIDKKDTEKYLEQGMFAEGSMAPKVRACLKFVEDGGSKAIITESTKLEDKSYGTKITLNYED